VGTVFGEAGEGGWVREFIAERAEVVGQERRGE
jgi:hypothetical protein